MVLWQYNPEKQPDNEADKEPWSVFFLVIDRNVSEMTEKKVISVRMFENIGQWTLLRRVLIQPRGQMTEMLQWPKRFSKIDWSVSVKKNPDYEEAHDKRWRSR